MHICSYRYSRRQLSGKVDLRIDQLERLTLDRLFPGADCDRRYGMTWDAGAVGEWAHRSATTRGFAPTFWNISGKTRLTRRTLHRNFFLDLFPIRSVHSQALD